MPTWGETLKIIQAQAALGAVDMDGLRRQTIADLHALTGRAVITYYTDFLKKGGPSAAIQLADMQGMMEVFHGIKGDELDLILHSPGGEAEATARLVKYMRSRFKHVRVFVPLAAMSAATMWAMAADEIVLGKHSQLGPIDPQVGFNGNAPVPAGALTQQFQEASDECAADPKRLTGWLPTLQQYPPGLLQICESAAKLSKELVQEWLSLYMFGGKDDAKAEAIAEWLADDKVHLSHSRPITPDELKAAGVHVSDLEASQQLQDAVLSVHHMYMHSFDGSGAVKIIENHLGNAWIQNMPVLQAVAQPPGPQLGHPIPQPQQPATPVPPNRQQRRHPPKKA